MTYLPAKASVAGTTYWIPMPGKDPVMLTRNSTFSVAKAITMGGISATSGNKSRSITKGNGLSFIQCFVINLANAFRFSRRVIEMIGKFVLNVKTGNRTR